MYTRYQKKSVGLLNQANFSVAVCSLQIHFYSNAKD